MAPTFPEERVHLVGTDGSRGEYPVILSVSGESMNWLDAAGFVLATSVDRIADRGAELRGDYVLYTEGPHAIVRHTFRPNLGV